MSDAEQEGQDARRDAALARLAEIREGCWPYTGGMDTRTLADVYAGALAVLLNDMDDLALELFVPAVATVYDGEVLSYGVRRLDGTLTKLVVWDEESERWKAGG